MTTSPLRPTILPTPHRRRPAVGHLTRGVEISATVAHAVGAIALGEAWHRAQRVQRLRNRAGGRRKPTPMGPIRLREMLERLGPTFTKLGQAVAGRPELLPGPYRAELTRLRDHVTPLEAGVAMSVLAAAYTQPLHEVFATLSPRHVAAGSIGQVHRATLLDGRTVAVKIRRPDAPRLIEADLRILAAAARTVHRLVPGSRRLGLAALVDEFAEAVRGEVDYALEAAHADQIRTQLTDLPWLTVPAMILPLCRPDVIVMDFVEGIGLTDGSRLDAARVDRRRLGSEVVAVNLQLILFNDVFHADPHPGNYLVTPDGRLAMLDFGQIGHSTAATRAALLHLLTALVTGDVAQTAIAVATICGVSLDDTADLGVAVSDLFTGITTKPLGEIHIGDVFHRLLGLLEEHQLSMPAEMTMLVKAVIECEATAQEIHAGLRLTEVIPLAVNRHHPPADGRRPGPSLATVPPTPRTDAPRPATGTAAPAVRRRALHPAHTRSGSRRARVTTRRRRRNEREGTAPATR